MNKENTLYTYNGILFRYKKTEILPFGTTWMDLDSIMLTEISKRKTISSHLYVQSKKKKKSQTSLTDIENKLVIAKDLRSMGVVK